MDSNDDNDSAEATGASAAASLVRTLRSWSHERTESVNSVQEALATRAFQAEQAAVDALRLVSRAEGHTRALVADLAHGAFGVSARTRVWHRAQCLITYICVVRALHTDFAMVGSQLCGVLESYANLLKTFEEAAARRISSSSSLASVVPSGSLTSVAQGSSPRLGPRHSVVHNATVPAHPSPLGMTARRIAVPHAQGDIPPLSLDGSGTAPAPAPPVPQAPQHARTAGIQSIGGGPVRIVSPRLLMPEDDAPGLSTAHTRLPPLRLPDATTNGGSTSAAVGTPASSRGSGTTQAGGLPTASPTTQSKRALFDAVAEAAAAGTGLPGVVRAPPLSGFLPPQRPIGDLTQSAAAPQPSGVSSPLGGSPSRGRRFSATTSSGSPFALAQPEPDSPGLLRLAPAGEDGSNGGGGSPTGSMLRLDPFRANGADAFLENGGGGGGGSTRFAESPPPSARMTRRSVGGLPSSAPGPPLALTPPVAPGSPRGPLRGMNWSTGTNGSMRTSSNSPARRNIADRLE